MAAKKVLIECLRCKAEKEANEENFVAHPETGKFIRTCRQCRNEVKNVRRKLSPEDRAKLGASKGSKPAGKVKPKLDPGPQPLRKTFPDSKVYVITYAQNATPVHKEFLDALLTFCKYNKAELVIIGGRYKNPTSIFSAKMITDEWWAKETHPYLFRGTRKLGTHLTVHGEISIQPTAVRPLTGFEVFSGEASGIFGHPKLQLKTIATAKRRYPRILTTTGAVTKANYTDTKAGKKAEAHHIYGATIVEQGTKLFHIRQINALKDGTFIDLNVKYTPSGVEDAGRALGLVCGDIHVAESDQQVLDATFDAEDSIVNTLRPKVLVYHDVLSFRNRSHHEIGNFQSRYEKVGQKQNDVVETEVMEAIDFLDERSPPKTEVLVVQSNHDEAFDRWLNEADPRRDPINARFYYETMAKKLRAYDETGKWTPAFKLLYEEFGAGVARFLDREEPVKIGGAFVNFHGDKGLDGGAGSVRAYAHLGAKTITGHGHSPEIMDGAYRVGVTGRLDQGYNHLPSSWMNSHCVIYANGKRALIHVIDGEWRG